MALRRWLVPLDASENIVDIGCELLVAFLRCSIHYLGPVCSVSPGSASIQFFKAAVVELLEEHFYIYENKIENYKYLIVYFSNRG